MQFQYFGCFFHCSERNNKKDDCAENESKTPDYFKLRSAAVAELKKNPNKNPYPHKFHVSVTLPSFIEKFSHVGNGEWLKDVSVSVAGRVHSIRSQATKLIFYDLCGDGVQIQLRASAGEYDSEEAFAADNENIRRGDIIGIEGVPGRTKRGELSIIPKKVSWTKCGYNFESISMIEFSLPDQVAVAVSA